MYFDSTEAEEVEGTDSGSADEEGPGDLISSSESDWEDDWISETDDLPTNHCSNPKASPNKSAVSYRNLLTQLLIHNCSLLVFQLFNFISY